MIDLRSDICSQPTRLMREAMHVASPGWATYGEDPAVRELESLGAGLLGHEACVLVPTCTMANLAALLVLAREGGVVVAEGEAHVLQHEAHGVTEIARLQPRPVSALDPAEIGPTLSGASVLWIENTHTRAGGTVVSVEATRELVRLARDNGARVHIDGARLANAAVALGVSPKELASEADTVALSLNKGLSAPYGALLAGSAEVVAAARQRLRQLGGGTVHKAGLMAAAGSIALREMIPRLEEDHRRARRLAAQLDVDPASVETNIVFLPVRDAEVAVRELAGEGVLAMARDEHRVRFVTHRLIGDRDVDTAAAAARRVVGLLGGEPAAAKAFAARSEVGLVPTSAFA